LNRLAWLDRPTGRVIRRYERAEPGELLHVDVKKLGRLRPGGGHRVHGRDSAQLRARDRQRRPGYDYVHAAVDDHSRLAYVEILPDERGVTCAGFLRRAGAFYAAHGVAIRRVLTDNARNYRSAGAFRQAVAELGAEQRFTRPFRIYASVGSSPSSSSPRPSDSAFSSEVGFSSPLSCAGTSSPRSA